MVSGINPFKNLHVFGERDRYVYIVNYSSGKLTDVLLVCEKLIEPEMVVNRKII